MKLSLKRVGERFKLARTEKGLTIEQAAALAGKSIQTIRRFEQGLVTDVTKLAALADAYGVNLPEILFGPEVIRPAEMSAELKQLIIELAQRLEKPPED